MWSLRAERQHFLFKQKRDQTGTAEFEITSEGLESAVCSIRIEPFASDNLVPVSEGSGSVKPELPEIYVINDSRRKRTL